MIREKMRTKRAVAVAAILMVTLSAHAEPLITNGSFENTGGISTSFSIKGSNGGDNLLPGWSIGTNPPTAGAYPNGNNPLDCLMHAGQTSGLCGAGNVGPSGPWQFWQYPGASPDGGNFVGVDGDSLFRAALSQQVTGLTPGAEYKLSFYQAAAQQQGFSGATTERWQVSFGGTTQLSTLMSTDDHGKTDWNAQSLTFTASAASQALSFLAVGTPNGQPPFVLLDGVSLTAVSAVPEPESAALFVAGLLGLSAVRRARQGRR